MGVSLTNNQTNISGIAQSTQLQQTQLNVAAAQNRLQQSLNANTGQGNDNTGKVGGDTLSQSLATSCPHLHRHCRTQIIRSAAMMSIS